VLSCTHIHKHTTYQKPYPKHFATRHPPACSGAVLTDLVVPSVYWSANLQPCDYAPSDPEASEPSNAFYPFKMDETQDYHLFCRTAHLPPCEGHPFPLYSSIASSSDSSSELSPSATLSVSRSKSWSAPKSSSAHSSSTPRPDPNQTHQHTNHRSRTISNHSCPLPA
jgi:hypothetical protein